MVILEFEARLEAASSIKEINGLMMQLMQHYKVTMYSFTYYGCVVHSIAHIKYSHASKDFDIWHQHYIGEGYQDVDNTMHELIQGVVPVAWDLNQQLAEASTPRERQMRTDSIALGAQKGITFPLHGPGGEFATFLVVQMQDQSCLDDCPHLANALQPALTHYFQALRKQVIIESKDSKAYELSAREMQVLKCISSNMPVDKIAATLNITKRTVNFHIQRINKKLGVKNKYHSVNKAIALGLIKI
jgi:DNA-binding CsgD family transcriptional regulator